MKKLAIVLLSLGLVLCLSGGASATVFTDVKNLDATIAEGPFVGLALPYTYTYQHDTPVDFEVPYDIVNSATLQILGYFIDDDNDVVEIQGSAIGTLTSGGTHGSFWGWSWDTPSNSSFNIEPTFASWSTGSPFDVTITGNGGLFDGIIELSQSTFTLDYENGMAPVPEPATILLMGVGLLGLAGFGRKKMSKKG